MGIKSLAKNCNKVDGMIVEKSISEFKNKSIGIDATGLLHRLYKDSDNIQIINNLLHTFKDLKIKATFVFDNNEYKEPLKDETCKSRRHDRDLKREMIGLLEYIITMKHLHISVFKKKVYDKVGSIKQIYPDFKSNIWTDSVDNLSIFQTKDMSIYDIRRMIQFYEKELKRPSKEYKKEAKKLIQKMGFPILEATKEADFTLGYLYKKNHFDYIYSDDTDLLALGVDKLLSGLNLMTMTFHEYQLDVFLTKYHLDKSQFLDLCILLGTDYTIPVYQIQKGPNFKFCLQLIQNYQSFEGLQPNIYKYVDEYPYLSEVNDKYLRIQQIYQETFEDDESTWLSFKY